MDRSVLLAIVFVLASLIFVGMAAGWRSRRRRQSAVAAPLSPTTDRGIEIGVFRGSYVATTTAGLPLDRIVVHGLGFRGAATATFTTLGLAIAITGRDEFWIAGRDLVSHDRATWAIDRVVEPGGLDVIQWRLGDSVVDSYFRFEAALGVAEAFDRTKERTAA